MAYASIKIETGNNQEKKRRIQKSIREIDRFINRESARSDALRPAETQDLLDRYKGHKKALKNMLLELDSVA